VKYARMRDANERPIIEALRAAGAFVTQLDGSGIPDLLISYRDRMLLAEVKLPLGPKGGKQTRGGTHKGGNGVLTEAQVKWWAKWTGPEIPIVRTPDEALALLRAIDEQDRQPSAEGR